MEARGRGEDEAADVISIVIPALNEERNLQRCLESIAGMDTRPESYEIIVVDNGSVDRTCEIASSFGTSLNIKVMVVPGVTVGGLRNIGVAQSKGSILAFLDADCTVSTKWATAAVKDFEDPTVGAVGCTCVVPDRSSWVARCWDINNARRRRRGEAESIASGNLFVRRKSFLAVRGFDEALITNEDYDLCFRLRQQGWRVYSDPEVMAVHWGVPKTLWEFYRREVWHGRGVLRVFLGSLPSLKNVRAIVFGFWYAGWLAFLAWSIVAALAYGYVGVLGGVILVGAVPALVMSMRAVGAQKKWYKYALGLSVLYWLYGIGRAVAVADCRNWVRAGKGGQGGQESQQRG